VSSIRLSTQRIRVVIGNVDDPDGWREMSVQTINPDRIGAENELNRRKLTPSDHHFLMTTAMAYCAFKRTGQLTAGTFADFEAGCIDLDIVEDEAVDPTPSAPIPE